MSSSISCELVFLYENVSCAVAEQQGLAFATVTPVTASVDGPCLCFQLVHMRRETALERATAGTATAAYTPHARHGATQATAVTSVRAIRVRETPSFTSRLTWSSATAPVTFNTEVELYRVPLSDVRDSELQLDPVHAQQAEKPFAVVLTTHHVEARSGLRVASMELQNIPYGAIASFYGTLQEHWNHPETCGAATMGTLDEGLVRSRSVSQQPLADEPSRVNGLAKGVAAGEKSSAFRYGFLYPDGRPPGTAQTPWANGADDEDEDEARAAGPSRLGTHGPPSDEGDASSPCPDPVARPTTNSRYSLLSAVGELASSGARGPKEAHRLAKAAVQSGQTRTAALKENRASTKTDVGSPPNAALTNDALPPGTVVPAWFPAWDTFAVPTARPTKAVDPDTVAATSLLNSVSATQEVAVTRINGSAGDGRADTALGLSAEKTPAASALRPLDLQRELYVLKELRDRTNELEQARLALDELKASMEAAEKARQAHDADLIRQFPHLTPAQRLLVDFDRLLCPLPAPVESTAAPDNSRPDPVVHGEVPLQVRRAVLELVARSSLPSSDAHRTATSSPTPATHSGPTSADSVLSSQRAYGSYAASPTTAPFLRRSVSAVGEMRTTPLTPRLTKTSSVRDLSTPLSGPARTVMRPGGAGAGAGGGGGVGGGGGYALHTHAPLVAPRQQPATRHRQHNEASTVPTAPTPVASSTAPSSPVPAMGRGPSSDSEASTLVLDPLSGESSGVRTVDGGRQTATAETRPRYQLYPGATTAAAAHGLSPPTPRAGVAPHAADELPHRKFAQLARSQTDSDARVLSPPLTLAGTMPPDEPAFLLDDAGSHSMAT